MKKLRVSIERAARFTSLKIECDLDWLWFGIQTCQVRYPTSKKTDLAAQGVPVEGAIADSEGRLLFAMAVASDAQKIVELGTYMGHSTNYLAEAARRTLGHVDTVDLKRIWNWHIRGSAITRKNRTVVTQHFCNAAKYLERLPDGSVDFIFEDTDHSFETTGMLIHLAQRKLRRGGILAVHDVFVSEVPSCKVAEAIEASGLDFLCLKILPAQQGLAIWRKP
jgi:predicted O-methyltransferase YrrM